MPLAASSYRVGIDYISAALEEICIHPVAELDDAQVKDIGSHRAVSRRGRQIDTFDRGGFVSLLSEFLRCDEKLAVLKILEYVLTGDAVNLAPKIDYKSSAAVGGMSPILIASLKEYKPYTVLEILRDGRAC